MKTIKDELKVSDRRFLNYNKRNILMNLLQAEQHARDMQTISFIKGEGSCFLKHLLFVKGEVEEAINASSSIEPQSLKVFEKLKLELDNFFSKIETGRHRYTKRDLINLTRKWRKLVEQTTPWYKTFRCKCLHSIPYLKSLMYFVAGSLVGVVTFFVMKVVLP